MITSWPLCLWSGRAFPFIAVEELWAKSTVEIGEGPGDKSKGEDNGISKKCLEVNITTNARPMKLKGGWWLSSSKREREGKSAACRLDPEGDSYSDTWEKLEDVPRERRGDLASVWKGCLQSYTSWKWGQRR